MDWPKSGLEDVKINLLVSVYLDKVLSGEVLKHIEGNNYIEKHNGYLQLDPFVAKKNLCGLRKYAIFQRVLIRILMDNFKIL